MDRKANFVTVIATFSIFASFCALAQAQPQRSGGRQQAAPHSGRPSPGRPVGLAASQLPHAEEDPDASDHHREHDDDREEHQSGAEHHRSVPAAVDGPPAPS